MTQQEKSESTLMELVYVEEPSGIQEYASVLDRVAIEHQAVVVQRRGVEVAAVISLEHLQLLQDALAYQKAEQLAADMNWSDLSKTKPPAQWLEGDEPKPF